MKATSKVSTLTDRAAAADSGRHGKAADLLAEANAVIRRAA